MEVDGQLLPIAPASSNQVNLSTDSPVRRQKRLQSALDKYQRFTGTLLLAGTLSIRGIMIERRCCDHRNFPRTRLSGTRLSWPTLAKAMYRLARAFHWWETELTTRLWAVQQLKFVDVQVSRVSPSGDVLQWPQLTCWMLKLSTYRLGCGNVEMAVGVSREFGGL